MRGSLTAMGISIGLVGLGAFGSEFAPLFNAHPLVDRVALCDREPERVAKFARDPRFQAKFRPADAYTSLDDICRADLDALVLITQPWLHAPQAIQAMESGKHVYSAVPVIWMPDAEEVLDWCDRVVRACERTGMHYMLGETTYYRPETMYCRRRAAEGAFGDFVYAEGEYFHPHDWSRADLRTVKQNRLASAAGREWAVEQARYDARGVRSTPMTYPTHSTSGPISVMKTHALKVSAIGWKNRTADSYFDDHEFTNVTALYRMANGAAMRICEHRELAYQEDELFQMETFRLFGTKGTFRERRWAERERWAGLTVEEMRDRLPADVEAAFRGALGTDPYGGHGGSHAFLVHEFVSAIAGGRRPAINAWEAARYMAAGCAAERSARRDGELVDVPDWGDAPA
jgi:predicted dehydrogenase